MPVPPPSAAPRPDAGAALLPSLYAVALGPLNADYYLPRFERYEALGRSLPQWNHGAAFCTLGWLGMRRLWRLAVVYLGLLALLAGLAAGMLTVLPPAPAWAGVLLLAVLACVVPGLMGTALYWRTVRRQTLQTLRASATLAQTRQRLAQSAVTPDRLHTAAAVQVLLGLLLAAAVFFGGRTPQAPHIPDHTPDHTPAAAAPAPIAPIAPVTPAGPTSTADTTTAPPELQPGQFYVNSGLYRDSALADAAQRQLQAVGLEAWPLTLETNQGPATRLRAGPFPSRAAAEAVADKMDALSVPPQVFQQPEAAPATPAPAIPAAQPQQKP